MKILVTGAKGFVGKNLCQTLKTIRDGTNLTRPELHISEIYEYDTDSSSAALYDYCKKADFIFHFAGVNRCTSPEAFMQGNYLCSYRLLEILKSVGKASCPVMLASSAQATLMGRYDNDYGRSKKAAEDLFFSHAAQTGARVLVYRFPNLFGKWCRPNYNSVVATFCYNIAHDLPIQIHDTTQELELVYIDDLVDEMLAALECKEHRDGQFCYVPCSHKVKLVHIAQLLERFHDQPKSLLMPEIPSGSFEKKLYSTYLSYLPKEKVVFPLKMHSDDRGSFTELLKTANSGQFSVNVSKPGITKGQHWHHSKWEMFVVVSGHGLIQQRRIGTEEILEFEVSGDMLEAVYVLPGYVHNIINLSQTENLVTLMWANEPFAADHPDTYFKKVKA